MLLDLSVRCLICFFLLEHLRPSRVQSSPGQRGRSSAESTTPQPPRPVTAAALPSQTPTSSTQAVASDSDKSQAGGSGIQLSDLQTILSGIGASFDTIYINIISQNIVAAGNYNCVRYFLLIRHLPVIIN